MSAGYSYKFLFFMLAVFFLAPSAPSHAVEPPANVTLEELLGEAMANNPELLSAREIARAKGARARAEGALDDPTLRIEMEDLSMDKPLNAAPGNAMLTRYTVSQMFPFYGKRSLKEKIAVREALQAEARLRVEELDVAASVKEAFYEYARLAGTERIMAELKDLLSYMSSIAEARYSAALASQQDVVKAQVEASMIENDLVTIEAEKAVAQARLNALLNRPQGSVLAPPAPVADERVKLDVDELIKRAWKSSPPIKAMEYESQASELAAALAKKNYYPDFMVGVAPIQRDGRFDSYDLMFQINIPLWRSKYDSQTQEAVAGANGARFRLMSERNLKAFEIKEAALRVEAAGRIKTLYDTSLVPQTELSFESALKNYQSGKVDFLTLLDTERTLKRIRIERLNSLMDYKKKGVELEKAVGEDIFSARNGLDAPAGLKPEKGSEK